MHTVLILTSADDPTADRVAAELTGRGVPIATLDPARFPSTVSMSATIRTGRGWEGALATARGQLDLASVGAVYSRRPTQFVMDERMSDPERVFAYGEARRGFGGVLAALGLHQARWVNDPLAAARAEYKPVQLAAATGCGLAIPNTLITSSPDQAYAWAKTLDRSIVYKPLSGVWHADEGSIRALFTSPVASVDELLDPKLSLTAHLFQEQIPKAFEARAVVVAERVFTVRIDAHTDAARTDWRRDYDGLSYARLDPPAEVKDALVALHRRLGLLNGATDLIVEPSGRWVFLETNPRGEWFWLEDQTGAPIAAAMADLLQQRTATP